MKISAKLSLIVFFALSLIIKSCETSKNQETELNKFYAIIEIPAGTNKKFEYDHNSNDFKCEIINGEERTINYLPYPANYGFIPDTYMDPLLGGDGDPLDVLVLEEAIPTGQKIKIQPLAIIKLLDSGEEDHKIIAIPSKSKIKRFKKGLPSSVKDIISIWFCNYKNDSTIKFLEWGNQKRAIEEINKWKVK